MYEYTLVTEIMLCIKIIHFCLPGFLSYVNRCMQMVNLIQILFMFN